MAHMMDDKVHCILKAKEYEYDYWDGDRLRLRRLQLYAGTLEAGYKDAYPYVWLKPGCSVLDVGCGKSFRCTMQLVKKLQLVGFDMSQHALSNKLPEFRGTLFRYWAQDAYPFGDRAFDLGYLPCNPP